MLALLCGDPMFIVTDEKVRSPLPALRFEASSKVEMSREKFSFHFFFTGTSACVMFVSRYVKFGKSLARGKQHSPTLTELK
jgi:hypothetical protein